MRGKGQEECVVLRCDVCSAFARKGGTGGTKWRRNSERMSQSQLPKVIEKENDREVRRNILGLEQCVYAQE